MSKILERRVIGDPILRKKARPLKATEIKSSKIKELIADMSHTLKEKRYGIALAAPQVGESLAVVVINLKKTPTRPDVVEYNAVLINPKLQNILASLRQCETAV